MSIAESQQAARIAIFFTIAIEEPPGYRDVISRRLLGQIAANSGPAIAVRDDIGPFMSIA
eukprot:2231462-Pleurochrysis_carterae.AAC.6